MSTILFYSFRENPSLVVCVCVGRKKDTNKINVSS